MAQEDPFWIVWAEGGGSPTVKHPSPEHARVEARRLALAHPGIRFVVLEPISAVVKNDLIFTTFKRRPEWADPMDEEIPF